MNSIIKERIKDIKYPYRWHIKFAIAFVFAVILISAFWSMIFFSI